MGVYAHPDDESTCAGGVFAHYADQGVRVIVVTCTNGEFGDGPNGIKPGQDGHDIDVVVATRAAELDAACRRLGVSVVERLGYHDSGMPGWERHARGEVFSTVPVQAVAARIVDLLNQHRPDVVLTHNATADHEHRDHRHAARATALAVAGSGAKLYFSAHGAAHWQRLRQALPQLARPKSQKQCALDLIDARITTRIDIRHVVARKRAALFEHVSQLGSSLAGELSLDQYEAVFGVESFIRVDGDTTGNDLFDG
ncbi:LmbE family N-acetylglucosaminyl deacetylase [Actinocrispum wychmicini]|uniref:LmbE family N-acetylglucosaminyl deacetylase n=2 Tax=Actinocrispum wychmicini TaxID=1213861 RepID=A0A4R2J2N8_9PSEU|nr:LmbE family N-acetylglucosaminyl deacetylase [Actinocrispum wychmicini]